MDKNIMLITQQLLTISDQILLMVAKQELSASSDLSKTAVFIKETISKENTGSVISYSSKHRKTGMLETALNVASLILDSGYSFRDASRKVAKDKGNISIPSVLQACCRAQGMISDNWHKLSNKDEKSKIYIAQKLITRYMHEKDNILKAFGLNSI